MIESGGMSKSWLTNWYDEWFISILHFQENINHKSLSLKYRIWALMITRIFLEKNNCDKQLLNSRDSETSDKGILHLFQRYKQNDFHYI